MDTPRPELITLVEDGPVRTIQCHQQLVFPAALGSFVSVKCSTTVRLNALHSTNWRLTPETRLFQTQPTLMYRHLALETS